MAKDLRQWVQALQEIGGICWYCGRKDETVIEHIIPESRGGANCGGNLAIACRSCNTLKRDMTLHEWRSVIKGRSGEDVQFAFEEDTLRRKLLAAGIAANCDGVYRVGYSERINHFANATARVQI